MFTAGIIGAISGFVIGGVIGGLVSAKQGNSFLDGFLEGSVYGLINGFTTSAILFCGSEALKAIVKPSCCFIAGTVVLTEEGNKAIEDIEAGDMVWAYNEETDQKDQKRVVRLFRNETEEWFHINIYKKDEETCEEIICTPEHPFYILNADNDTPLVRFEGQDSKNSTGNWVAAKDLTSGMKVLLSNGEYAIINNVEVEHLEESEATYNFEVADYHTYFVGQEGILVHNTCPKVNIDGEEIVVYRGYNGNANNAFNMNGSTRGLKMNGDIVLSQRGLSLNANPSHPTMLNFESVGQLTYLPDELLIVPKPNPTNLLHCEVIPNPTFGPMTYNQYKGFLNQIRIK